MSLGVLGQWAGQNIVSYYLGAVLDTIGITSVRDQTLINGCMQIWNLMLAVSAALPIDRLGRRPLFLASCDGPFASFADITDLSGSFDDTESPSVGVAVVPVLLSSTGSTTLPYLAIRTSCSRYSSGANDHILENLLQHVSQSYRTRTY
ncbi:sugar transporter [Colletotrichum filicis]|nr:sugar transporter [Colletotrichum filicis]